MLPPARRGRPRPDDSVEEKEEKRRPRRAGRFPLAVLIAAVAATAAPAAAQQLVPTPGRGPDGAFEDCPCIDHRASGRFSELLEASGRVQNDSLVLTNGHRLPRNYGSGRCYAWDDKNAGMAGCHTFGRSTSCSLFWCYVDKDACNPRRHAKKSILLDGLYYSYATCGNVDSSFFFSQDTWLAMAPIYVYAFGVEVNMRPPTDGIFRANKRVMLMFAYQMLPEMNLPLSAIRYRSLSEESSLLYSSSYSRCVHDLALGHIDICAGDYWDTPERRQQKAAFTTTVYSEFVYLYSRHDEATMDFWDYLYQPLRPFTGALWALIVAVVVASAGIMSFFEFSKSSGDEVSTTLKENAYISCISFVTAGVQHLPRTKEGKIFGVMLSIFICVTIASFTANTASFLIFQQRTSNVADLSGALDAGLTVGVMEAMAGLVMTQHPGKERYFRVMPDSSDLMEAAEVGDIDVAILPEPDMVNWHSKGRYCEMRQVGRPIFSFPTGLYVSARLLQAFSWASTVKRQDGTWAFLETRLMPPSICSADKREWEEPKQLEANHMLGNCLLLLLCFAVSLVLWMLRRLHRTEPVQHAQEQVVHQIHRTVTTSLDCLDRLSPRNSPRGSPRPSLRALATGSSNGTRGDGVLPWMQHGSISSSSLGKPPSSAVILRASEEDVSPSRKLRFCDQDSGYNFGIAKTTLTL